MAPSGFSLDPAVEHPLVILRKVGDESRRDLLPPSLLAKESLKKGEKKERIKYMKKEVKEFIIFVLQERLELLLLLILAGLTIA